MCEFTKLMKGTKYEKKDPELTYELMVQLAVVKEEEADPRNIPMNIGGDPLTEWNDGHKLDDLGVMPGTDESKWKEVPDAINGIVTFQPNTLYVVDGEVQFEPVSSTYKLTDPIFTTDKDGYVYVDIIKDKE